MAAATSVEGSSRVPTRAVSPDATEFSGGGSPSQLPAFGRDGVEERDLAVGREPLGLAPLRMRVRRWGQHRKPDDVPLTLEATMMLRKAIVVTAVLVAMALVLTAASGQGGHARGSTHARDVAAAAPATTASTAITASVAR